MSFIPEGPFSHWKCLSLRTKNRMMKALVIGATGAVGKDLVQQLLADDSFERVDIFVRRP